MLIRLVETAVAVEVSPLDLLSIKAWRYLELLDQDRYEEAWQKRSPLIQALGNH